MPALLPTLLVSLLALTGGHRAQDVPGWNVRFPEFEPDSAPADSVFVEIEGAMVRSGIGRHFWIRPTPPPAETESVRPATYTIAPARATWRTSLQRIVDFLLHLDHGSGRPLRVTGLTLQRTGGDSWRPRIQVAAPAVAERQEPEAAEPLSGVAVFRSVVQRCAATEHDLGDLRFTELSLDLMADTPALRLKGTVAGPTVLRALVDEVLPGSPFLLLTEENRRAATQVAREDGRLDFDVCLDIRVDEPAEAPPADG